MAPHTTPSARSLDTSPPHRGHWLDLPAERTSVQAARHAMTERLTRWGVSGEPRADAILILSELATNAVVHALSTRILCGVMLGMDQRLHIEVHDHDRRQINLPPRPPGPEDENGRGLLLVRQLADKWGVARSTRTGGNAVWATLLAFR
ncbi:ATP-binding protein [Actinacidiphila sp. bgisy160]|uniref:ATP-binding protein n=1 Tax=Actinacidiphila sp. bgisy160 TaxID=3413796 RepID=UPI003D72FD1F